MGSHSVVPCSARSLFALGPLLGHLDYCWIGFDRIWIRPNDQKQVATQKTFSSGIPMKMDDPIKGRMEWLYLNEFKSYGFGTDANSAAVRRRQKPTFGFIWIL